MATPKDIENWFTYHKPTPGQQERYIRLRVAFKDLATLIVERTLPCPDQTAALRKLRECAMAVNQTIACNESEGG
jgi:hypothetical protein